MSTPKVVASATRQINAVVVSAGLMQKTVKARVGVQKWNGHIKKHFNRSTNVLVHDPNSSLRIGDIISISPGWRYSKHVHHVVNSIIAPFGDPIEARPAIPTLEERLESKEAKWRAKVERRWAKSGRPGSPWDIPGKEESEGGGVILGEQGVAEEVPADVERLASDGEVESEQKEKITA